MVWVPAARVLVVTVAIPVGLRGCVPRDVAPSVKVTLPYFAPAYMDPGEWRAFTAFMHRNGLLKLSTPDGAFTNALLPASK